MISINITTIERDQRHKTLFLQMCCGVTS